MKETAKAGVRLSAEGGHATSKGVRLRSSGGTRTVTDGPFAEAKEVIAGFATIEAKSKEEAIEWASRFAKAVGEVQIDIRQVIEMSDFV